MTCIGGYEVGWSIVGKVTLVGGVDEVQSRLICLTSDLTEFMR